MMSLELLNPLANRLAVLAPDPSLRHEATCRLATKLPNLFQLASVTGNREVNMLNRYYNTTADALAAKLA